MKHIVKNLLFTALILFVSTTVVSAQHNMNHSKKDSTKQMQHKIMMDSTKHMNHEMMDSTKMHDMTMDSSKMMNLKMLEKDDLKQTMKMDSKSWNAYCPVRGEKVDPEAPTVEYMGKTIGFCCPGCDDKFKADPEKYMKNLNKDGNKFIGNK